MSFSVVSTIRFFLPDGREAKPAVVYEWLDIDKRHVINLEHRLNSALLKLSALSEEVVQGKVPKPGTTDPVEMTLDCLATEDGRKWSRVKFEWPKMGVEQQQLLIGVFDGELANADTELKSKGKIKGRGRGW
jgi:hypothetical protein